MRAYLAVIKDAFRAAIAAKLLYVMLVLIALFLLVLLPLSYKETLSSRLREVDIRNAATIAERLHAAEEQDPVNADAYLWSKLSERTQTLISEYVEPSEDSDAPGEQFNRINQLDFLIQSLLRDLRGIIEDPGFYDAEALADIELDEEGQELAAKNPGQLTGGTITTLESPGARRDVPAGAGQERDDDDSVYLSGVRCSF